MKGKRQEDDAELPTQIKARHWETRERGGARGGGGWAGGLKIDLGQQQGSESALPETNGHLPLGGQERQASSKPERQKSGRFQNHSCPCRKNA